MRRAVAAVLLAAPAALCCTTMIVGKDASADGSVMCSHSDDGESNGDARLYHVPAKDHPEGAMRDIHWDGEDYPDAGPGYPLQPAIGQIPEVRHTYARYSATYGIMNEKQVGIAESTCSGVFGAKAVGHGGKALMSVDALSRIGLERCDTARCTVQTMGDLAVKYGFYGAGSFEGSAESLLVIDKNEGWIFHVLPDHTETSAVWVAQRVDDDKAGVVANMFTIREVNLTDTAHFLGSPNMLDIAENVLKAWSPADGLLDFTKVFSDGEYAHKYYSGRRMWGAYRMMSPSNHPTDEYDDLKFQHVYPTFMKPDHKLERKELFAIHRTYYEGTKHDQTVGLAAGAWGNPDRWNAGSGKVKGSWERTIGLFRTTHTHLVQARSWLPDTQGGLMWFAPHCAPGSVFVPFCAGCESVATDYTFGNPNKLDRSAYWAHRYVFNVMHIKYGPMHTDVKAVQESLEAKSAALVKRLDGLVDMPHSALVANLTAEYNANAAGVVARWWQLPDMLVEKYADGYLNDGKTIPYTNTWLEQVGFSSGPPPAPCPPCPCTPLTSPQCSHCCGNHSQPVPVEVKCDLRQCVRRCDAAGAELRVCLRRCDAECQ